MIYIFVKVISIFLYLSNKEALSLSLSTWMILDDRLNLIQSNTFFTAETQKQERSDGGDYLKEQIF